MERLLTARDTPVALSGKAFDTFFRRVRRGEFPRLEDRDDLWQLLFVITVRKATNLVHYEGRLSRGSGRVRMLSDLSRPELERVLGSEPTPVLAAQVADECRWLL